MATDTCDPSQQYETTRNYQGVNNIPIKNLKKNFTIYNTESSFNLDMQNSFLVEAVLT